MSCGWIRKDCPMSVYWHILFMNGSDQDMTYLRRRILVGLNTENNRNDTERDGSGPIKVEKLKHDGLIE
ncbi:hypothetical protein GJ496_009971 [Pomphorhynchus laevis]|nr:hypothetical protein GJ496_009971 [Pomphorhynchus laevis]